MDGRIITLTPEQAVEILRSYGMIISTVSMREALKQKVYPFGDCILSKNGTPRFCIYKKLLYEWIEERLMKEEAA